MISSPYFNFLYEISLYLKVGVYRLNNCFQKTVNISTLYVITFIDALEEGSEKSVQKVG